MRRIRVPCILLLSLAPYSSAVSEVWNPPVHEHKTVDEWILQLDSGDEFSRREAASALGWLGPKAKRAAPSLLRALQAKDPGLRENAAYAIGRIGPAAKAAAPQLSAALKDEHDSVCMVAATALIRIKAAPSVSVPAIIRLLDHENQIVRSVALETLGCIGPDAKKAVAAIIAIGLSDSTLRYETSRALRHIGSPAVPALVRLLKNDELTVRRFATKTLGEVGKEARSAVWALRIVAEFDPDLRKEALAAICAIDPDNAGCTTKEDHGLYRFPFWGVPR